VRLRLDNRRRGALPIFAPMLPTIFFREPLPLGFAAENLADLPGLHHDRIAAFQQAERLLNQAELIELARACLVERLEIRWIDKVAQANSVDRKIRFFNSVRSFLCP
jgi:hypothetical protein